MRINNNITAVNTHRMYGVNNGRLGKNMEKLSSGFRINRAADDAAGLAISEKMRAQIRGLNMASKNSQDAVSLVQVAEGGMQTIQDILQRMRELAVQAASDTNITLDRRALNLEMNQLILEIDEIARTTEFNEMKLLDGTFKSITRTENGTTLTVAQKVIQAGANVGQTMGIIIQRLTACSFGIGVDKLDILTRAGGPVQTNNPTLISVSRGAVEALTVITMALNQISEQRAHLGAYQNRLEYKIANLDNTAENLQAAESRIRDADMAKMMTEFTKNNILFQASTAMLAQANTLPQSVLQLLG